MPPHRFIEKSIALDASVKSVWERWTTEEGIQSFFAEHCKVELKMGGAFEMYFMPDQPEGLRGSEGCVFMAIEKHKTLSFSWNAPPLYPEIRKQRTLVTLRFQPIQDKTQLTLYQYGWGESDDWTATYHYFEEAWGRVLQRLQKVIDNQA